MNGMRDFTDCPLSPRNLEYGGRAGEKRGIVLEDGFYLLKFPKNTSGMDNVKGLSYVTSPLSEYIGCHIYEILGYRVQKTILGICHDGKRYKVVCACKDFIEDEENELLIPYTALRNDSSPELVARNEESSSSSGSEIGEIIFQLEHNTILKTIPEAKERFFDVAIIDMLINNNDRHEDNWGVIKKRKEGKYALAPIFDCGNSFYGKAGEDRIKAILLDPERLRSSALNGVTAYDDGGKEIRNRDLVAIDDEEFRKSMKKVASLFGEKFPSIIEFIDDIPSSFMDVPVMSENRKKYYIETMKIRYEEILLKALD